MRTYQNSPDGLRWQLQDILNAARSRDGSELESLIRQTEIPNYEAWFTKTFGQEKGESWAGPYGRDLGENQKNLETLFMQIAGDDGEFYTSKVNDNPGPPGGMEAGIATGTITGLQGPAEFFYASWKKRGALRDSKGDFIGYFVFLDGKFRWDSRFRVVNILSLPSPNPAASEEATPTQTTAGSYPPSGDDKNNAPFHPGVGGVGYPSCNYCPAPEYTKSARKKKMEGIVVLQAIIQTDGRVTDIQVVKSPYPELTEMALEGVNKWHMNPARRMDGEPVPAIVPIEVTFRLLQ